MPQGNDEFIPDDGFAADEDGFVPDAQPSQLPPKSIGGFASNVARSGTKFLSDSATGLNSLRNMVTPEKAAELALRGVPGVGPVVAGYGAVRDWMSGATPNAIRSAPSVVAQMASGAAEHAKNRYGSPSIAANTLYEDPVGVASDVSMVAGGTGALLKGASLAAGTANLPRVAAGAGRAAQIANTASLATNPLTAPLKMPGVQRGINQAAEKIYGINLKPSTTISPRDREAMVRMGLTEKIPTSRGGLDKVRSKIDDIDAQVAETIQQGAQQGLAVDPRKVVAETARSRSLFRDQVNPSADLAAIDSSTTEFLTSQAGANKLNPFGNPIPIDKAQKVKSGTYRKLRGAYGELTGATKEVQKDLARGLKEGIFEHFPQLRELGQKERVMIQLEEQLERFVGREGNKLPVSLNTPLTAAAGGGKLAAIQHVIDRMPGLTSRIAAAVYKADGTRIKPARIRQIINAASAPERGKQQQ